MGKIENIERAHTRIDGVSQSATSEVATDPRQAILKHEVLFFRSKRQMTKPEHEAFVCPTAQKFDDRPGSVARINLETDSGISQEIHDVM